MVTKYIGIHLQDSRPCPISISSSPVTCLMKDVFPAPVIPITTTRMDLLLNAEKGIPNFLVQRSLKWPCSEEESWVC